MSMKNIYLSILFSAAILTPVKAADLPYKEGELLIRFAPKADGIQRNTDERNQILSSSDAGTINKSMKLVPGLSVVKLPLNLTVADAMPKLRGKSQILYVEPNYKLKLLSTLPDDTRFNELWAMHNTGQTAGMPDADIDAPEAWDINTDAGNIIVAVIDSGIDYTHPDLAANLWVNPGEIPNNGLDDDGNGYVDDIYGYDFYYDDSDPMDYYGHGTHCGGTIGAVGNNDEGVTGVCWNVKLMNLKISMDNGPYVSTVAAISAIEYAIDKGAKVLSNSWGGVSYSQSLKDEIEAADANGVLFVTAAGNDYGKNNDTYPVYPASYDCNNIISVMATNHTDQVAYYSNYGPTSVDIGAPGGETCQDCPDTWGILSTIPGNGYAFYQGTSMATPHVAGACALIWSMNRTLNHLNVRDIILNSVDRIPALNGLCVTGGRLNLYNAVFEAANRPEILSNIDDVNDSDSVLPGDYITYTISYANPVTDPNDPNYIGPLTDVQIIDYLPIEVDPNNPFDPNYDPASHTYTWDIGTLSPGDSNCVTLTVIVNGLAEPLGTISNICFLDANEIAPVIAVEVTDVSCWGPGVIYVDRSASGLNTGMSWLHAYTDMQDALERARAGCGSEIRAAKGTYRPAEVVDWAATFELVDGVAMYGGFPNGGGRRNWVTNETILTGDIYGDGQGNTDDDVNCVVTASNVGQLTIIDGFTIKRGYYAGIEVDSGLPIISNSRITDNAGDGVYCNQSTATITNCTVEDNADYGIYEYNPAGASVIMNSIIRDNAGDGIYFYSDGQSLGPGIANNWIYDNGGSGVRTNYTNNEPNPLAAIGNNTIVGNDEYGVMSYYATDVVITNCIIWDNGTDELYAADSETFYVTYSCIEGTPVYNGEGNINSDPCFVDVDANNFHLAANSPCIDAGDPDFEPEPNETDIDGAPRVINERVDMGADEFWRATDFSGDGLVNFVDYSMLARHWHQTDTDPGYSDAFDLWDDDFIDFNDVLVLCEDWLSEAPWSPTGSMPLMAGRSGGGMTELLSLQVAPYELTAVEEMPIIAEPVDVKKLLDWLAEIWLDPEVRERIDAEAWLRLYESLKE